MDDTLKRWDEKISGHIDGSVGSIIQLIRDDDVFIDVGANTGLFSGRVAKQRPNCQFYLFEPILRYYKHIEERFADRENFHCYR